MPNLSVVFYNRNFTGRVPSSVPVRVDRYSWSMIGGPDKAYLQASVTADKWELMKLLRCPVEIYGDDGSAVWWGYVNRVSVPNGDNQRVGKGLDELYNYIIASYTDGDTTATSEAQSIAEYGQKEKRINISNANQTQAEQQRDIYLAEHQYPSIEFDFSGGRQEIQIECYGWYKSLDWKYYADSDQTNTANETQIQSIVTSAGQFLNGSVIEDATGFTSNEYRDGTTTALTSVNQLLNAGTTNTRPLLAYVDKDRYLHVYERAAEPLEPSYLLQQDNKLTTLPGDVIADQECRVGVWAKLKDAPGVDMPAFFIESAEYDASENRTSYRPAGSYEQVRLAQYIASITDSNDGGGVGGGVIWWTPEADPLTYDIKTVYGSSAADIATGATLFLHPASSVSSNINSGDTELTSSSVNSGARDGWVHIGLAKFIVIVYAEVIYGSSAPTSGYVTLEILRSRVTGSTVTQVAIGECEYPRDNAGGADAGHITVTGATKLSPSVDEGFTFRLDNHTDGDVRFNYLKVIFIKV